MPYQQGGSTVIPAPHIELQRVWRQLRSPGHATIHFVMQQVWAVWALRLWRDIPGPYRAPELCHAHAAVIAGSSFSPVPWA
jgi:hypothetical protein